MYNVILFIANLDLLPLDDYFIDYFSLDEPEPYNSNFEDLGYEAHSFIINFGTMFAVVMITYIQMLLLVPLRALLQI